MNNIKNISEVLRLIESLGDYHEVDGEDVYDAPSTKQIRPILTSLITSIEKDIEGMRPSKPYPNASNGYASELDEDEKVQDELLTQILQTLQEYKR